MTLASTSTYVLPLIAGTAPTVAVIVAHVLARRHREKTETKVIEAINGGIAHVEAVVQPNGPTT